MRAYFYLKYFTHSYLTVINILRKIENDSSKIVLIIVSQYIISLLINYTDKKHFIIVGLCVLKSFINLPSNKKKQ